MDEHHCLCVDREVAAAMVGDLFGKSLSYKDSQPQVLSKIIGQTPALAVASGDVAKLQRLGLWDDLATD